MVLVVSATSATFVSINGLNSALVLVLVDDFEVSLDNVFILASPSPGFLGTGSCCCTRCCGCSFTLAAFVLVDLLPHCLEGLHEFILGLLQSV